MPSLLTPKGPRSAVPSGSCQQEPKPVLTEQGNLKLLKAENHQDLPFPPRDFQGFRRTVGLAFPIALLQGNRKSVTAFVHLATGPSDLIEKLLSRGLGMGREPGSGRRWFPGPPAPLSFEQPPGLEGKGRRGESWAAPESSALLTGSPADFKRPRCVGFSNCEHYFVPTSSQGF